MKKYTIKKVSEDFSVVSLLSSGAWDKAEVAEIDNIHETSSQVIPAVSVRLLYNDKGIFGRFEVKNDRYIRCVCQNFQDGVCTDSCVEFFVQPTGNKGYLNFEFSGSGALLTSHIVDWTRTPKGFADFENLSLEEADGIISSSTLPRYIEELEGPATWELGFFIPFKVFERRGLESPVSGSTWRGNLYKCGDKTKFPHWISWNPVDELNFHLPRCFGEFIFA